MKILAEPFVTMVYEAPEGAAFTTNLNEQPATGAGRVEANSVAADQSLVCSDEGHLLLAALAAALVEYQRQREHGSTATNSSEAGNRWRTLARWEQLRGRA